MTVKEREPGQRIHWDDEQKAKVLTEARRLRSQNPRISMLSLMQQAQTVLEEKWQRKWTQFGYTPSNAWFHEHIDDVVGEVEHVEIPVVEVDILDQLTEEIPHDLLSMIRTFIDTMEEDRELSRDDRFAVEQAIDRISRLEKRFEILANQIETVLSRGFVATFYPTGLAPVPLQTPTSNGVVPAPPKVEPLPLPPKKTRKPKVVVLNLASGHEKEGLKRGVEGVLTADFLDVGGLKVPNFDAWDYVICTKRVPTTWIEIAKGVLPREKIRVVPGNVRDRIVPYLLALPPIEIRENS